MTFIPSLISSFLIFWFYLNIPDDRKSLLTTGAKSVIAWHTLVSVIIFLYFAASSILSEEVKALWDEDSQLMCSLTPFIALPYFATAVCEFHLLRVWFALTPYQVLAWDSFTYPSVLSIPLVTATVQSCVIWSTGTYCEINITKQYLFKLNMKLDVSDLRIISFPIGIIPGLLMLGSELFLRLHKWCRRLKFRNRVATSNSVIDNEVTQISNDSYDLGTLVLVFTLVFILSISIIVYGATPLQLYVTCVLFDFVFFGMPLYWLFASPDIINFSKFKFNQLNSTKDISELCYPHFIYNSTWTQIYPN